MNKEIIFDIELEEFNHEFFCTQINFSSSYAIHTVDMAGNKYILVKTPDADSLLKEFLVLTKNINDRRDC